jgi:hypothetical protein
MMDVEEYLKQVKVAAEDIARICREAVVHQDSWPSLKSQLDEEIKKQDEWMSIFSEKQK